jgi:hypothetical protein
MDPDPAFHVHPALLELLCYEAKLIESHLFEIYLHYIVVHCKKGYRFSRPQPGSHQSNSLAGNSLVCDIPAGDGNIANLFLPCTL